MKFLALRRQAGRELFREAVDVVAVVVLGLEVDDRPDLRLTGYGTGR
jgi:hypothetical protein